MLGDGIIWNASSHRAPLATSLSFSPANPASADALAQDILEYETTNLQEQPRMMLCNDFPGWREGIMRNTEQ